VERIVRQSLLVALIVLAVALSLLNIRGLMGAGGLLTAFESSGWKAFGLLASSNQFAELVELALPVCLARALFDRQRWLVYALAGALLYAAAIGSRSRMGALLATCEIVAVLVGAWGWRLVSSRQWKRVTAVMLISAAGLALAIGVAGLFDRLRDSTPLAGRSEILSASVQAIRQRPLTGFGLGSFSTIYPSFAVADLGGVVTHAHDDYVEAICDGGLPLLGILLLIFGRLVRPAWQSLWGLGVIAVLLHGAVDFPLQRISICSWMFLIAGALEADYFLNVTGSPVSRGRRLLRSPR
jgi:O-antigen ligase